MYPHRFRDGDPFLFEPFALGLCEALFNHVLGIPDGMDKSIFLCAGGNGGCGRQRD